MRYLSTRGGESVTAAQAIVRGISPSGGLYVPETFPQLDLTDIVNSAGFYADIACKVMAPYLDDALNQSLRSMIQAAYKRFDTPLVAPVHPLTEHESVLELWHGPTMAFKDVALQMLPHFMKASLAATGEEACVYILVATSGDTGKAALEGFCDVEGTRVLVFYPDGGVSKLQRLQMVTQPGGNVDVCAVRGNFDDAQTGVKQIFASEQVSRTLAEHNCRLSSANSINFGRLLPQIVYYFSAYAHLVQIGRVQLGEPINFCVPTGNFGDILAGEYARRMGLPVRRLICASNRNNVLTDFFETGVYDDRRPFYKSMSCSIDILISSNLERLLFDLCDRDAETVREWMQSLRESGRFDIGRERQRTLAEVFTGGWCTEQDTLNTIRKTYQSHHYLIDPHTAVGQTIYERYAADTHDATHTVLLSTASPYKFASDVLGAFETPSDDDFTNIERLHKLSGMPVPNGVKGLCDKPELHLDVCELADMPMRVLSPVTGGKREGV